MRLLVHLQAALALSRPYALELALCRPSLLMMLRFLALSRPLLRAALIILLMHLALSRPWLLLRGSPRALLLAMALSMR
jgi:hypothetical protein